MTNSVYRQIQADDTILGLEKIDLIIVFGVFQFGAMVSSGLLIPIGATASSIGTLRWLKRGKPKGWTFQMLRFFQRKQILSPRIREEIQYRYRPCEVKIK